MWPVPSTSLFRRPVPLRVMVEADDRARLQELSVLEGKPVGRVIGDMVAAKSSVAPGDLGLARRSVPAGPSGTDPAAFSLGRENAADEISEPAGCVPPGRPAPEVVG